MEKSYPKRLTTIDDFQGMQPISFTPMNSCKISPFVTIANECTADFINFLSVIPKSFLSPVLYHIRNKKLDFPEKTKNKCLNT
jgi:hypothetical protein